MSSTELTNSTDKTMNQVYTYSRNLQNFWNSSDITIKLCSLNAIFWRYIFKKKAIDWCQLINTRQFHLICKVINFIAWLLNHLSVYIYQEQIRWIYYENLIWIFYMVTWISYLGIFHVNFMLGVHMNFIWISREIHVSHMCMWYGIILPHGSAGL